MAMGENLLVTQRAGQTREVRLAFGLTVGGGQPLVIAGPCSVESREQMLAAAQGIKAAGAQALRGGAFKPRTSPYSFQGLGEEGLRLLAEAREATGLPVVTEVMDTADTALVASYADVLQVGARNMQNFSLLKALGRIRRPVILKRGPAATVEEWLMAAEYILAGGNEQVILCERGVRTFERHTRNTLDLASALAAKGLSNLPVIVDPSHGTGRRELVGPLSKAAIAAGLDGLMLEVHPNPEAAWSDGPQSLDLQELADLMVELGLSRRTAASTPAASAPAAPPTPPAAVTLQIAATPPTPAAAAPTTAAGHAVPDELEPVLPALRQAIDQVDQQLLALLQQRMTLAVQVGRHKARTGEAVYQPLRERALLEGLAARAQGPLSPEAIRAIWGAILQNSRLLQLELVGRTAEMA